MHALLAPPHHVSRQHLLFLFYPHDMIRVYDLSCVRVRAADSCDISHGCWQCLRHFTLWCRRHLPPPIASLAAACCTLGCCRPHGQRNRAEQHKYC